MNKDMIKIKKQIEHWQQQAGLSAEQRALVDLSEVSEERSAVEE